MFRRDLNALPKDVRPISPIGYIALSVLFCIPVAGLVFNIILASSAKNVNRRNFARACLVPVIAAIVLVIIGFIASAALGATEFFEEFMQQIPLNNSEQIV